MAMDLNSVFPLRRARVHEASGPGAVAFAAMAAAQGERGKPVVWIRDRWRGETLNPLGLAPILDPSALLIAQAKDQDEGLAVMEETLRDGSVPFAVVEIGKPLSLTAGRRLQLAAKAGQSTGLCLIPEGMGSNAAETRWHCAPVFDTESAPDDSTLARWEIIKNKSGTLGAWNVRWDAAAHRLHVVSPAGD